MVHVADESKVGSSRLDGYIVAEKNGQLLVCSLKEKRELRSLTNNQLNNFDLYEI